MKKHYITPETKAVKVLTSCLLAASDGNLKYFDNSIDEENEVDNGNSIL